LRLIRNEINWDMLGARVEIIVSKIRTLWRLARTDGSYLSANDPRVIVVLGSAVRVEAVLVHCPEGVIDQWKERRIDQYTTLEEGASPQKR